MVGPVGSVRFADIRRRLGATGGFLRATGLTASTFSTLICAVVAGLMPRLVGDEPNPVEGDKNRRLAHPDLCRYPSGNRVPVQEWQCRLMCELPSLQARRGRFGSDMPVCVLVAEVSIESL